MLFLSGILKAMLHNYTCRIAINCDGPLCAHKHLLPLPLLACWLEEAVGWFFFFFFTLSYLLSACGLLTREASPVS